MRMVMLVSLFFLTYAQVSIGGDQNFEFSWQEIRAGIQIKGIRNRHTLSSLVMLNGEALPENSYVLERKPAWHAFLSNGQHTTWFLRLNDEVHQQIQYQGSILKFELREGTRIWPWSIDKKTSIVIKVHPDCEIIRKIFYQELREKIMQATK